MNLFLRLREQTRPQVSPATNRYLTDLGYSARGVLEWCNIVPRYIGNKTIIRATSQRPTTDTLTTPLQAPTASWWWDQLTR